jgi:hypothetical protein
MLRPITSGIRAGRCVAMFQSLVGASASANTEDFERRRVRDSTPRTFANPRQYINMRWNPHEYWLPRLSIVSLQSPQFSLVRVKNRHQIDTKSLHYQFCRSGTSMICSGITTSQYRLARPEKAAGDTNVFNFALNSHLSFDKRFLSDRSRTLGLGPSSRRFESSRPDQ